MTTMEDTYDTAAMAEPVVEYASADDILATPADGGGLDEEDVTIRPGVVVRVRELTRKEMLSLRAKNGDIGATEAAMVSMASVEPKLTERQVTLWQERKGFKELELVTRTISRLSGLDDKATNKAYKSV
jgi:hypothetical protein